MAFKILFQKLFRDGGITSPRGERTLELTSAKVVFENDEDVWCTFPSRQLSLSYTCAEFLWYLRADPADMSIAKRAPIWRSLISKGILQSNYGVYLFRDAQFLRCVNELRNDPDSRRASILILQPHHFYAQSADIPCTYSLNFRIRDKRLDMTVHMRSNDAWFGAGNDCPTFRWTQHMMADMLSVPIGTYTHLVDSLHIYERHWEAAERCLDETASPVLHPSVTNSLEMIESEMLRPQAGDIASDFHRWLKETSHA
jgi:thymidylate synthase